MSFNSLRRFCTIALFLLTAASVALSQEGTIRVNVTPEEAYIFVDNQPFVHRSNTLTLPTGDHTIGVYNYGFVPQIVKLYIEKGGNPPLNARLTPVMGMVSGPWGRIQIEGVHGDTLVFLNDTKPEFFVAHADEANNNILNKQQIVAPVGMHTLFLVNNKNGQMIWSGPVEVKANQRLILYTDQNAKMVYKDWPEGATISSLKRFEAGVATATIAVAPVTGKFFADRDAITCGQPVRLSWNSTEAVRTTVMANNNLLSDLANGDLSLSPKQTTTYEFHTIGPGGIVSSNVTVHVDTAVRTTLVPSTNELRYVKVGDKVVAQDSADLKWTATNADAVRIDPIGTVTGASGYEKILAVPRKTSDGTLDETHMYKLTATNVCGGSDSSVASLHLTGSIAPEVAEVKEPELPHTASPLPLLALLGAASLGSGFVLRRFRKTR